MWEDKAILNTENRIFTFQQTARSKCSSAWTSISLVSIAADVDNRERDGNHGWGGMWYIRVFSRHYINSII